MPFACLKTAALVLLAVLTLVTRGNAFETQLTPSRQVLDEMAKRPLAFESNQGQASSSVQFVSRTPSFTAVLESNQVLFSVNGRAGRTLPPAHLQPSHSPRVVVMEFAGATRGSIPAATGLLTSQSNYFLGSDPKQWHPGVRQYSKVTYPSMYPKIDVAYYGSERELEYDLIVAPSGDPNQVRMRFKGQDRLRINPAGNLVLCAGNGALLLKSPVAYQRDTGYTRQVEARFVRAGKNEVGIQVGRYDHTAPLIIDPKLTYSSYLGGADDEGIFGIAFDPEGNIYVAGETSSLNFPVKNALQRTVGGSYDAFVSKFDRTGSQLVYSTYLGGSGYDHAVGLAVDAQGSAYVGGVTESANFPTEHALQNHLGGARDAFLARLTPSGSSLVFSTYLGGSNLDEAGGITIDAVGNAFITGQTESIDFPTTANALQPHCAGPVPGFCTWDAFVTEYSPTGIKLLYSTYLGGSGFDSAQSVAVDDKGSVYVVGQTESADFPVKNAFQQTLAGPANAFITKLKPAGLEYSTYLGGNGYDSAQDIAVDLSHAMYVTGFTGSTNFPTMHPFQRALAGEFNTFVTKLNTNGASLDYSTYLGGSQYEIALRIAVDAAGDASITGLTTSPDFPVANALYPAYLGGTSDAFVSRFDPTGSKLTFSSFLGGSSDDYGYAISTDLTGALWVGGSTSSRNLALQHPFQNKYGGGPYDAFLEKISLDPGESLDVLHAGIANFVLASQINEETAAPLERAIANAAEALKKGDPFRARLELFAFEVCLLEDLERKTIPQTLALRLGVAGYDILNQLK
jgi:hypothetical protein